MFYSHSPELSKLEEGQDFGMPSISPAMTDGLDLPSPNEESASASPGHSSKRRRTGAATLRGVSSLTPDQLAKKRANDREAQRAIRERTKSQIETLERKIQELTSQRPYQELQAAIRQKNAIQVENEEIRRRLESVLSVIQPIVTAHGLTGISAPSSLEMAIDLKTLQTLPLRLR
jgi:regulator of replication initiation timing